MRRLSDDDTKEKFKQLASSLEQASTSNAYNAAYGEMKKFVEDGHEDLSQWLEWWHLRRNNMFRAFTGQNKPYSNSAEVVHARWVNRGEVGMTLRESAEFDATDAIKLKGRIDKLEKTAKVSLLGMILFCVSQNIGILCLSPYVIFCIVN